MAFGLALFSVKHLCELLPPPPPVVAFATAAVVDAAVVVVVSSAKHRNHGAFENLVSLFLFDMSDVL